MRVEAVFFMDRIPSGEKDAHGDPELREDVFGPVYAEMKSISQSEFYQAQTAGKKPEIRFKITDYMDYQGQKYLVHDDVRYSILRTYRTGNNEMEITCYGGVRYATAAIGDEDD